MTPRYEIRLQPRCHYPVRAAQQLVTFVMQTFLSGTATWGSDKRGEKISRKLQIYTVLMCERAAAGTGPQEGKEQPVGKISPACLRERRTRSQGPTRRAGAVPVVAMQSKPTKA